MVDRMQRSIPEPLRDTRTNSTRSTHFSPKIRSTPMHTESLTFTNRDGRQLAGELDLAQGREKACAVFAHCFTCGKDLASHRRISRALTENGFSVLRFDTTGVGESEGAFAEKTFSTNVTDLLSAMDVLADKRQEPQLLVGHSLGGAACVFAAAERPSVNALATVATPDDLTHLKTRLPDAMDEVKTNGSTTINLGGSDIELGRPFVESLEEADLSKQLREINCPLLILHSPEDRVVGIESAAKLYRAARHPKSFICIDGADHLLSGQEDPRFAGRTIGLWAERYVQVDEPADERKDRGTVTVHTGRDQYYTELTAGPHELVADEPTSSGGTDRGPTPYEFLASGLGACTSMTLRMYADRKEWPLEGVTVELKHERIHAEDCERCETEEGQVDHITRTVKLEGDLTEEQRKRLIEIAEKCPVHRTLTSETVVETVEVE